MCYHCSADPLPSGERSLQEHVYNRRAGDRETVEGGRGHVTHTHIGAAYLALMVNRNTARGRCCRTL